MCAVYGWDVAGASAIGRSDIPPFGGPGGCIIPALSLTPLRRFILVTLSQEVVMVLIRNVFRLKFGKAKEAVALLKEGVAIQKRAGAPFVARVLTDVTGPFYTIVLELTVPSLSAFETDAPRYMGDKEFQANYQKLVPLVESGYREVFTVVE
jgi:hypothetical protein